MPFRYRGGGGGYPGGRWRGRGRHGGARYPTFTSLFNRYRYRRPGYGCGTDVFTYGHQSEDDVDGGDAEGSQGRQPGRPDSAHKDVLQVESVDFQVASNTRKHHTDEYDITEGAEPQLVVRRGQQFTIQVGFSRPYDAKKDDLRLVFEIGKCPKASKGTLVEFVLSDKEEEGQWGAKISQQSGQTLTIAVFTPPDCIVGKWRLKVNVVKKTNTNTAVFTYKHKDPIYMLFNPWCKEDTVFLEKADDLQAYVLKEEGKIYAGNTRSITPKPWVFGQFSGKVLDCCMYLLELSELKYAVRGNPILVVRKLTALVNCQDEDGVLTGNWSGDYSGGKSPLSWTGSAAILEEFLRTKTSVCYGQCWVFSGVLTTVCRALGIPARSVTNFSSAHDVDTSITIDMHYDADGNPMEEENEDSIWNFHVWNEAWMARPDLPAGYGGWQACDSTPQETSDGVYCCGPCPVRAVKEGEVGLPYDGPFIFAEVNADRVYWVQQADGTWHNVYSDKKAVGRFISTLSKSSSSWDQREDVTLNYKYPEGSSEERVAVRKANQVGSNRKDVYYSGPKDVEFELCFDGESTFVGTDFTMELQCRNTGKQTRTIQGHCSTSTMYYTGVIADKVAEQKIQGLQLKPGETKTVSVKVTADTYHSKLKDCCMLSLSTMAKVKETGQIFAKRDDTRLRKPHLSIKGPDSAKRGTEVDVEVSFTNPLGKTLTDCSLAVEGVGTPLAFPQSDVPAKGTFLTSMKLKAKKRGNKEIVAIFSAKELDDINGSHPITIQL